MEYEVGPESKPVERKRSQSSRDGAFDPRERTAPLDQLRSEGEVVRPYNERKGVMPTRIQNRSIPCWRRSFKRASAEMSIEQKPEEAGWLPE